MAETCSECGQVVSKAVTNAEIMAALVKHQSLDHWAAGGVKADWTEVPNVGKVRVVDIAADYYEDPGYSTYDIYIAFEISDRGFFRVEGEMSSYEGNVWERELNRVMKQKREIWVYE